MNEIRPAAVTKNFTMQNTMYAQGTAVLNWKITFPQFWSQRYLEQAKQLNAYYYREALQRRQYAVTQLYPAAKKEQQAGGAALPYELETAVNVTYNRACILSLYTDEYEFTGGAHGMTVRKADNWNLRTGKRIELCSLFPMRINCRKYLIRRIIAQIEKDPSLYFENYRELVVQNFDPERFYLTQGAIMIYFGLYEIAPYSSGIPVFAIPYEADPISAVCLER
ncbi:MAG: DUF3298 and DUF4163 domain-containing protein [Candidatus Fimivicinus sp.]|nr:DUF3298 and DUF4163 domain-containing protein [Oscillospiraceae bacterium]MDY5590509.1 DUF3298 and DUF4163 domain-containing protein [Candidatus Fimivicinus sp.]